MANRSPRERYESYDSWWETDGHDNRTGIPTRGNTFKEVIFSDDTPNRGVKNCFHFKWNNNSQAIRTRWSANGQQGTSNIKYYFDPYLYISAACADVSAGFVPDWDAAVQRAIPSLRNEFNLINFAAEFDDVRGLYGTLRENLTSLLQARTVRRSGGRTRVTRVPSSRSVSESYLTYAFGVRPLIADGRAILDTVANFSDRFSTAQFRLRRGNSFRAEPLVLRVHKSQTVNMPDLNHVICNLTISGTLTIEYGGKVYGNLPWDPFRAFMDYIGFYPDLSTLWNALPFSFLVDYVLPVGDALTSDYGWLTPDIRCKDGWISAKFDGNWNCVCKEVVHFNKVFDTHEGQTLCAGPAMMYWRDKADISLDGVDIGSAQFPSATQQLNVAALSRANFPRR